MPIPMRILSLGLSLGITLAAAQAAAQGRYEAWPSDDRRLGDLLDEVQGVVDEGRSARAAHPAFLGDLQEIIDRYRVPPRTVMLSDDFEDGELRADPAWQSRSGDFRVERGELRSTLQPRRSRQAPREEESAGDQGDPALRLLVGILGGIAQNQQPSEPAPEPESDATARRAVITSAATIENRFTLEFQLRSEGRSGETRMAVMQGESIESGYHLIYRAGAGDGASLQLIKYLRGRGYLVAEAGIGRNLDDGVPHLLRWSRDADGAMVVAVDDREWLTARDTSYRGRFTGMAIINDGGNFSYDDLEIYGLY